MKWWQFKNQIKKELKPVYVFIGKSEKLISEKFSNEIIKFNHENSPSEILNELNSNSLFSKKKIVLIKEGEKFKKNDLKQILEFHKSSDVILSSVTGRGKLLIFSTKKILKRLTALSLLPMKSEGLSLKKHFPSGRKLMKMQLPFLFQSAMAV